ncbi:MAG: polysaccharide deacetylase family protein [Chloroflexota bacterium]|nr:polysaccharide deacetylase family protein [Chloroflexota bacterium]
MKKSLLRILEFIAQLIPLWLYPYVLRRDWLDFFYHAVSDEAMGHVRNLYPVVPVAQFEETLHYLKQGRKFITYPQIHAHIIAGAPLPPKAAHISFDDGFAECFTLVRPMLQKFDLPGTFFVVTDWVDNGAMFPRNKASLAIQRFSESTRDEQVAMLAAMRQNLDAAFDSADSFVAWLKSLHVSDESVIDEVCRTLGIDIPEFLNQQQPYLTSEQIQQMHADGFTIGAHTRTHRKLMNLSDAEIETEIIESCRRVQEITGQEIVPFSFPHSAFGVSRQLLADIRARHPHVGLLFDTKGVRKDVNFIINRVWAERSLPSSQDAGKRKLHPLPEVLHYAYQEAWVDSVMDALRKIKLIHFDGKRFLGPYGN